MQGSHNMKLAKVRSGKRSEIEASVNHSKKFFMEI
jgi:hypothetical protein